MKRLATERRPGQRNSPDLGALFSLPEAAARWRLIRAGERIPQLRPRGLAPPSQLASGPVPSESKIRSRAMPTGCTGEANATAW